MYDHKLFPQSNAIWSYYLPHFWAKPCSLVSQPWTPAKPVGTPLECEDCTPDVPTFFSIKDSSSEERSPVNTEDRPMWTCRTFRKMDTTSLSGISPTVGLRISDFRGFMCGPKPKPDHSKLQAFYGVLLFYTIDPTKFAVLHWIYHN